MSNTNNKARQTPKILKTTDTPYMMGNIDLIYLKIFIDGIPTVTPDNFSIWNTQILPYWDPLSSKDFFVKSKGKISECDAQNVKMVLASKIDATVHVNAITHANKNDVLLIWKSINKYFAAQHTANHARF